jgi:hypothetical protein
LARDVSLDLEAPGPAAGLLRPPPAASPIAQERVGPGQPGLEFAAAAALLAVLAGSAALLAAQGRPATPAELQAAGQATGVAGLGVEAGRMVSALAAALAVAGVAAAGRSLSHSALAGLLAAALVAADPAFLLAGRLALPLAVEMAFVAWAIAWAASPIPLLHWAAGLSLAGAAVIDPWAALLAVPLVALLLIRGHIYAAPQHLALAVAQVGALPALAAAVHALLEQGSGAAGSAVSCLRLAPLDRLALLRIPQPGPGLLLVPDPVVWLGGAGALLALGLGAIGFGLGRFRVARAPGRIQLRVVAPLPVTLARGAWLLLLAVATPPAAWPLLFAIAIALGIRDLGEDAPGFGLVLALLLLGFAGLVLARTWGAVVGTGGFEDALHLVPWAQAQAC